MSPSESRLAIREVLRAHANSAVGADRSGTGYALYFGPELEETKTISGFPTPEAAAAGRDDIIAEAILDALKKLEAQADPEGQEYAYQMCYRERPDGHVWYRGARDLHDAEGYCRGLATEVAEAWVERALLGTWERVGD